MKFGYFIQCYKYNKQNKYVKMNKFINSFIFHLTGNLSQKGVFLAFFPGIGIKILASGSLHVIYYHWKSISKKF